VEPLLAVRWTPDFTGVRIIDQRLLPGEFVERDLSTLDEVCDAISTLAVRGAPAIGVAGALGLAALLAREPSRQCAEAYAARIRAARPTAVNLPRAIDRVMAAVRAAPDTEIARVARHEANAILEEDRAMCRRIGEAGAPLIPDGARILTHCNAGALATAGYGTALGVIRAAVSAGKKIDVFADETRPFLQGARLTAWELQQDGIATTVITDNMAGHFLHSGRIGCVVVGADRIAANGDVANKIGTYSVAVLAKENGIPFYVAAPVSTFDLTLASGDLIPIEQRSPDEVTHFRGMPVTPEAIAAANPAFDVTPARYITAIVCERGVARAPYEESLRKLAQAC
jgi:methylthioribose-1-phosphate isomerase